jgi:hypothetical protein
LQVSRNRRGKDLTCIYTDERPDLARELPNWMFDESYCAGMSLGPPQASIEALNELAAVLAAGGKSAKRGSRSSPSETKEAIRAQQEEPRPITTRAGSRTPQSNAVSRDPEREGADRGAGRSAARGRQRLVEPSLTISSSRLSGLQLAEMIHARACAASDEGNVFIARASGSRKIASSA